MDQLLGQIDAIADDLERDGVPQFRELDKLADFLELTAYGHTSMLGRRDALKK